MSQNRVRQTSCNGLGDAPQPRSRRLRRRIIFALACLAAVSAFADAAEGTRLRKRGARTRAPAPLSASSHYASISDRAFVTADDAAPVPAVDITPPDTTIWNGGYDAPYTATVEGTAEFLDYTDYLAAAGQQSAVAAEPSYQEPVAYESPLPIATPPADPGAVREKETRPAAKRGLRLRKKRSSDNGRTEASTPVASGSGATSAADPYETYAPPMPLPSVPETPSSAPSVSAFDWPDSGGMEEVIVPSAPEPLGVVMPGLPAVSGEGEAEVSRPQDKYSDNTTAKPRDQEKENTNYDQDGFAPEAPRRLRDRENYDAPAREKSPQPERIHSSPPTRKVDIFSPEALAYEAARPQAVQPPPTRMEVEDYRRRLEMRLLERYNNLPDHVGKVGRVTVVLSKPLQLSLDGNMIRAEFDQLVFDPWGKRIPELEEEYYVVTFGSGGAQQVRADPSIRVGLDLEKTYSERAPLSADPFARVPESRAFRPAPAPTRATDVPKVKMPEWWRPDFPELQ